MGTETRDEATQVAVRAEQIRTLYRQSAAVILMNPLNAAILSVALRDLIAARSLVTWVLAMLVITCSRLVLRWRYQKAAPAADNAGVWRLRFVVAVALTGLAWGMGTAVFFRSLDQTTELLVLFVVGGMTAGAAGTLSFYVPAFLGFATGALLPLVVCLALPGDPMRVIMAALVVLFGVTLTVAALNTQRALTDSIRLRFVNEHLLQRLSSAQRLLEEANRTLEERVVERSAALERQSEALREAQRMESVGLLAGGVAHDFNNLLTVVMGNVSVLARDRTLGISAQDAVGEIGGAASRAAGLVKQLLAFGRRQVLLPKVLDLNVVIRDMQGLLGRLIGDHIELIVSVAGQGIFVKADPRQLEQVIINLATNARDAMPRGGRLTIATDTLKVGSNGQSLGPVGLPPGEYVTLNVVDSGMGMDGETRRQVFDPFFTTKELGKGTGLGLATVHGIVEQSGGHIVVDSQPGEGSRFTIYLPRAVDELPANAREPAAGMLQPKPTPGTKPSAKVLVAEDNILVRNVLSRILIDLGHQVLLANNGEEAREVSRAHQGEIDLLVTDVMMAKMGGLELAQLLHSERPTMRLLFISGYSWDKNLPPPDPVHGMDFLQKPFTPRELAAKVIGLLVAGRAGPAVLPESALQSLQRDGGRDQ